MQYASQHGSQIMQGVREDVLAGGRCGLLLSRLQDESLAA